MNRKQSTINYYFVDTSDLENQNKKLIGKEFINRDENGTSFEIVLYGDLEDITREYESNNDICCIDSFDSIIDFDSFVNAYKQHGINKFEEE